MGLVGEAGAESIGRARTGLCCDGAWLCCDGARLCADGAAALGTDLVLWLEEDSEAEALV